MSTFPLPKSATHGAGGTAGMLCVIVLEMKRSVCLFLPLPVCFSSFLSLSLISAYQYGESLSAEVAKRLQEFYWVLVRLSFSFSSDDYWPADYS